MKKFCLALAVIGLTAVHAEDAPKAKGELGSEWVNADGNTRRAQVGFTMGSEHGVTDGLYRPATPDWEHSKPQSGKYPGNIDTEEEGTVRLTIVIGENGALASCAVRESSGSAALDGHACDHLKRNVKFRAALGSDGMPVERSYFAAMRYELVPRIQMAVPAASVPNRTIAAKPLVRPDLGWLAIDKDIKPLWNQSGIAAALRVAEDGNVTACTVTLATYDDATDKQICDRLIADMRYEPAIEQSSGKPVASVARVFVPIPK